MMNMEVEDIDEDDQLVTLHFENDLNVKLNKLYLREHSAYFDAMFNGNFVESQAGHKIHIEDITLSSFMSVIKSLKQKRIIFEDLTDLLLILEVSQLLQFPYIINQSIKIISERYLYTMYAVDIFPIVTSLGIKTLIDKSRAYILYNFNTISIQNRNGFLKLEKVDLQTLLNNNTLNVDNEMDVFDLIVQWCLINDNYKEEYDLIVSCVRFKVMNQKQLECCISKTNNSDIHAVIEPYFEDCPKEHQELTGYIRPIRRIPFVLCAVKNETDGCAFVYRWDWTTMQFVKFIRLDPLPLDTTGYHVIVNELDVYVMAGEIAYGRGSWNKEGWKYNLLSENWKRLKDFTPSNRRHGVGHFIGDELFLLGGLTKHRLANQNIELFKIDRYKDTLVKVHKTSCQFFQKRVDRKLYVCLEYKGHLAMITKDNEPTWFDLCTVNSNHTSFKWRRRLINISDVVICATCYQDIVYMLAYDKKRVISLFKYCPLYEACEKLKSFNIVYDEDTTMCAFNVDKAMVFKNDTFEYYSVDNDFFIEYKIQLDSFHSNYLFSVPIYIEKTC